LQTLYRKYDTLNWHLLKFLESFRHRPRHSNFYTAYINDPFHRLNLLLKIIQHGFVTISHGIITLQINPVFNMKVFTI
jgi:hypothetical protein